MPRLIKTRPVPARSVVRKISGYEPLCLFARGGMALVFVARSTAAQRLVAIKTLRVSYADDAELVAQFADEMRIAHLLRHPNIVELVEAGVIEGEPYLVLEFIGGPSLRLLSERHVDEANPMSARLALTLVSSACRGLDHAHELTDEWGRALELVHRDVSPQNLMLTQGGVLKVVDFGVAKAVGQTHKTVGRGIKGKMAYAAPEYIRGESPDRRADVFGLGVVLWELLANRRLFFKPSAVGTMQAVVYEEAEPPSKFNTAVPSALDDLVLAALAKQPERRIGSAGQLAEGLEEIGRDLGGLMASGEVAELLATSYRELIVDQAEISPEPSEPQARGDFPARSGEQGWASVEIDLDEIDGPGSGGG